MYDARPDEELQAQLIERRPCTTVVEVVPQRSEHTANTHQKTFRSVGMMHAEGGWPKDVDRTEPTQTARLLKRVERDEDYIASVARLGAVAEDIIRQNNALDIYEELFAGVETDHSSSPPEAKTLTVFRDPAASSGKRAASYVSWHASGARIAVAYSPLEFQSPDSSLESYVWDLANPSQPRETLKPSSHLCCLNWSPKNDHWLAGGQYNGQVAWFDLNAPSGSRPAALSPIDKSHKDPVYDVAWLQSKTGVELLSCSTDGEALFWDIRRLEEPVESLTLTEKGGSQPLGACCLEYDAAAGATKFMIGTESGVVVSANRKAKTPADRIGTTFGANGTGHRGPIYAVHRNPAFLKNFLTVGDWGAMVWTEDIKTPLMTTPHYSTYLTAGSWSPTRPALFYLATRDGQLDAWDLHHKSGSPALSVQVTDCALSSLSLQPAGPGVPRGGGRLAACGDASGSVSILSLSDGLVNPQPGEKAGVGQLFEREFKREKNLEARIKEQRAKARKREKEGADDAAAPGLGGDSIDDAAALGLEKAFFAATKEESVAERDAAGLEEASKVTKSRVDRPGRQSSFMGPTGTRRLGEEGFDGAGADTIEEERDPALKERERGWK